MTTYSHLLTDHDKNSVQETRYALSKLIPAMRLGLGTKIATWSGDIELTKAESASLADAVEKILNDRLTSAAAKQMRCCNSCDWTGEDIDCITDGDVGPLCPECHWTTDDLSTLVDDHLATTTLTFGTTKASPSAD